MFIKTAYAAAVLASGFCASLAALYTLFGSFGGDNAYFVSGLWWLIPVLALVVDVLVAMLLQRYLSISFAWLDYVYFVLAPYVAGIGIFLLWARTQ